MALSVNQFGGYLRADQTRTEPDTQLYFNPISYGAGAGANKDSALRIDPFSGFILCYQPSRPTSRGRVEIADPNPFAPPKIDPNYLATEDDQRQVIQGGRLLQGLGSAVAFQQITKRVVEPSLFDLDDQGLLDDFRARAGTVYHPVGTCRMGVGLQDAAVDTQLRVLGIDGLRVVDASVFPTITSANTHAPTLMVAERAAKLILKDAKDR
jgi:choline dehydrogenase